MKKITLRKFLSGYNLPYDYLNLFYNDFNKEVFFKHYSVGSSIKDVEELKEYLDYNIQQIIIQSSSIYISLQPKRGR